MNAKSRTNIIIIIAIIAAVVVGGIVTGVLRAKRTSDVLPVFTYFVSSEEEDYEAAMKVVEELKLKYEGKVEFDIRDVALDPQQINNIEGLEGNIPVLYMIDSTTNINSFVLDSYDKATLEKAINQALETE